jgi:hypothetical protein
LDVFHPGTPRDALQLSLALMAQSARSRAPVVQLQGGWNKIAVDLQGEWLPPAVRAGVEQIEWELSAVQKEFAGWILLGNMKSA